MINRQSTLSSDRKRHKIDEGGRVISSQGGRKRQTGRNPNNLCGVPSVGSTEVQGYSTTKVEMGSTPPSSGTPAPRETTTGCEPHKRTRTVGEPVSVSSVEEPPGPNGVTVWKVQEMRGDC